MPTGAVCVRADVVHAHVEHDRIAAERRVHHLQDDWMLHEWREGDVFVDEVEDPLRSIVVEQGGDVDEADAHVCGRHRPRRVELVRLSLADSVLQTFDLVVAAPPEVEVDVGCLVDRDGASAGIDGVLTLVFEDALDAISEVGHQFFRQQVFDDHMAMGVQLLERLSGTDLWLSQHAITFAFERSHDEQW